MNGTVTKYQVRSFRKSDFDDGSFLTLEVRDIVPENDEALARQVVHDLLAGTQGAVVVTLYELFWDAKDHYPYWQALADYCVNSANGEVELY